MLKKAKPSYSESIMAKIRQKQADIRANRSQFWTPPQGPSLIRILAWREDEPFYFEIRGHFIPWGGANGRGIVLLCLETLGKPCLACKRSDELLDSDNEEERNLGTKIRATSRYLYNIVDLAHPDEGVQIWANWSEDILNKLIGWWSDPDIGDFTDPKTGRNIIIKKKGEKPPRYDLEYKAKVTSLQNKDWLRQVKDLRKFAPKADSAEMAKLLGDVQISGKSEKSLGSLGGSSKKKERLIKELECFSREYKKLDTCPKCPVRRECKVAYKKRKLDRLKAKAMKKVK